MSKEAVAAEDLADRVRSYYQTATIENRPLRILAMAELAPGIIAVLDSEDDIEIAFDVTMWQYTNSRLWEERILHQNNLPSLAERKMHILCGPFPPMRSFGKALWYAQTQLTSALPWHPAPVTIQV